MNKEMRELLQAKAEKKELAMNLLTDNKKDEAKALVSEIEDIDDKINILNKLSNEEKEMVEVTNSIKKEEVSLELQAFKNAITGKKLTEEMRAALKTSPDEDGGIVVPVEIHNQILEAKRQYVSLRNVLRVIPVSSTVGNIPVEDAASLTDLIDFDEVSELGSHEPKFKPVYFSLKNKGAITPISNALLQDTKHGLPAFVTGQFGRKAVRTENKDILAELSRGKVAKALANIDAFAKSVNKDLDPALVAGGVVITNQDGYHHLEQQKAADGRSLLQPSLADANAKTFKGMQVIVLSNAELPTTGTTTKKAPVFYGNLFEGAAFLDRDVVEVSVSSEAGFTKHQTLMKFVTRYDVKQIDADAYVYGELDVTATI